MQITGRIQKVNISQYNTERTVKLEIMGSISEDQEKQIIEAFMKNSVEGVLDIENEAFGKKITFDLGATLPKK